MIHFSGDTDGAVPTQGTNAWTNWFPVIEDWRPYYHGDNDNKLFGGYIREHEGFTFATVHGAGHMAPQFKPAATYHLIFTWLKGQKV